jgi:hypothetical protein
MGYMQVISCAGGAIMKKALCLTILLVLAASGIGYSSSSLQVKGVIINVGGSSIEIKKGKKELELFWTEQTKVKYLGKDADRTAAEICQKAVATYAEKDGRNELVQLDILTENYCTAR